MSNNKRFWMSKKVPSLRHNQEATNDTAQAQNGPRRGTRPRARHTSTRLSAGHRNQPKHRRTGTPGQKKKKKKKAANKQKERGAEERKKNKKEPGGGGEGKGQKRRRKKKKKKWGGGRRSTTRQGPGHPGPENTERQRQRGHDEEKKRRRRRKNQKPKKQPQTGQPQPGKGGTNQERGKGRPQEKVRRTRTRPGGRPAQPGQEEHAHTQARDLGVASSDPKGEVSASTRNSPGAPAGVPIRRRTVRETGRVSDRVHTRKQPQRTQPKGEAGGTRQGQPHRRAPNRYDAERAEKFIVFSALCFASPAACC